MEITAMGIFSAIVSVGGALLAFFAKQQFSDIKNGLKENYEVLNKRIDHVEKNTNDEINGIKKELGTIKGDFAATFVLREDFFRSMNGVEDRIKSMDGKIDKILMNMQKEN